jgi:hypothetical protein
MSVEMIDTVNAARITGRPRVVAGYIDGRYAWDRADWALPPVRGAIKNLITVTGLLIGNTADVENGDMTPADAPDWIRAKQEAGHRGATIYCQRSRLEEVWAACHDLDYYIWVADWTGEPHQVPGTIATQYANLPEPDIDLSSVYSGDWIRAIWAANEPWPLAA